MEDKEKINNLISELKEISDNHLRQCNMDEECDHSRADGPLIIYLQGFRCKMQLKIKQYGKSSRTACSNI